MNAYTVVGPTNVQPRCLRSFDSAIELGVEVIARRAAQVTRRGRSRAGGAKLQR